MNGARVSNLFPGTIATMQSSYKLCEQYFQEIARQGWTVAGKIRNYQAFQTSCEKSMFPCVPGEEISLVKQDALRLDDLAATKRIQGHDLGWQSSSPLSVQHPLRSFLAPNNPTTLRFTLCFQDVSTRYIKHSQPFPFPLPFMHA